MDSTSSADALRLLRALYEHAEGGYVSIFGLPSRRCEEYPVDQLEQAVAAAERLDLTENAFFGVGLRRARLQHGRGAEQDISAIPGVWLDLDYGSAHKRQDLPPSAEAAREVLESLELQPSALVDSGAGLHAYWIFREPWTLESAEERQRAAQLVQAVQAHVDQALGCWGLDATHDLPRVLRVPGTHNWKYHDRPPVQLLYLETRRYAPADLDEMAGEPDWPQAGPASSGGRNDTLKGILTARLERGEDLSDTVRELLQYDWSHHQPAPLFWDRSEFRGADAQSNATLFAARIMESVNRRRLAQGLAPERLRIEKTHAPAEAAPEVFCLGRAGMDSSPYAPFIVEPGLLGDGDLMLVFGPPKSSKSWWVLDVCRQWALGEPWLDLMVPSRPLKIAYLQFELKRDAMRRRARLSGMSDEQHQALMRRFACSAKHVPRLADDDYCDAMAHAFSEQLGGPADVLVVDPLANIYTGDSENDNPAMMRFLVQLGALRDKISPHCAIILVHHANKTTRDVRRSDPFNALRGASSLRASYDCAVAIDRIKEGHPARSLWFEVRNGPEIPPTRCVFDQGTFVAVESMREAGKAQGERWDLEACRKAELIVKLIREESEQGRCYTLRSFAEQFANQHGLGSCSTLKRRLREYQTKQLIMAFNGDLVGLEVPTRYSGHLCVPDQVMVSGDGECVSIVPTWHRSSESEQMVPADSPEWKDPAFYFDVTSQARLEN